MPVVRREDLRMKIPALIHLTRLGYRYLPLSDVVRNTDTNILPDVFHCALEKINGRPVPKTDVDALLEDIRASLEKEDLGEAFFSRLRSRWRGLQLIDFDHPERNLLHVMTELPCVGGSSRFRPDITLLVNGMPLAFVEVKSPRPGGSIRSELNRMDRRARNPELRRFINETQIMVFSNDMEEKNPLIPLRGAFYATTAYRDFVYHALGEHDQEIPENLPPADPEEVRLILRDNRLEDAPRNAGSNGLAPLAPHTPTHRLLTSLFQIRRLVFFLRYGIFYLEEPGESGQPRMTKQIVRFPHLFATRFLEQNLSSIREGGTVWQVPAGGKAALLAVQLRFLADYFSRLSLPARFFYLTDRPERGVQVARELKIRGFPVREYSPFLASPLREADWISRPEPLVEIISVPDWTDRPLPPDMTEAGPVRRVYFLDELGTGYEAGPSLLSRLRTADPAALMIAYAWNPEASLPEAPSTMLFGSHFP